MQLAPELRRFLLVGQCAVPAAINFAINFAIVLLLFRGVERIPLWGSSSMGVDLLATGFLLPLLMCMIVSRIVEGQVRKLELAPLPEDLGALTSMPDRPVALRALALGLAGMSIGAVPLVALLVLVDARPVEVMPFALFKGAWAALLAALVSPIIAWWALVSASEKHHALRAIEGVVGAEAEGG